MAAEPLGEGEDNVAHRLGGMVVRCAKEADPHRRAARVAREAALLRVVAEFSPLPVPRPTSVDTATGCMTYPEVPGTPLIDLPREVRARLAASVGERLGAFLAALHAVSAERLAGLADVDDDPPARWLDEAVEHYTRVNSRIPHVHHAAIEAFLETPPPPGRPRPVFSHNDLGAEHVLVDPASGEITGVIDWSDAAFCDPARDLGLVLRDLGPAALDAALRAHGGDIAPGRAVFYARCGLLEDLDYGSATGRAAYAIKSLDALDGIFPA